MTATATAITPGVLTAPSQQAIPMSRLVKVELRKMRDTRAGKWLLGITAGLVVAGIVGGLLIGLFNDFDFDFGVFVAIAQVASSLFLPILGIMLVTQEWGQRTGMVTFTLVPHRGKVIWAKLFAGLILAVGVAVLALVVGALANLVFVAVADNPGGWDISMGLLGGFVLSQIVSMLTGFALATLLLNTPAAIVVFFVYSWVLPFVFGAIGAFVGWFHDAQPWFDFNAAQVPLFNGEMHGDDWLHLIVSSIPWLWIPLAVGLWRVFRAEVK